MGDVYNLREERDYPQGFSVNYFDAMRNWLQSQNFNVNMEGHVIKGEKRGTHVNFKPEIMIVFTPREGGAVQASVHYYAKIKVATGIAVGILTSGISTLFGAATFASHASDADGFMKNLFNFLENNARSPSIFISKTGADGFSNSPQVATKSAPPPNYQSPQPPHYPPQGYYPPQQQQQGVPQYSQAPGQSPSYAPPQSPQQGYGQQGGYYSPPVHSASGYPVSNPNEQSFHQPAHSTLELSPPSLHHQPQQQNNNNELVSLILPDLKSFKTEELERLLQFYKESAWKVEREIMERKMGGHQ